MISETLTENRTDNSENEISAINFEVLHPNNPLMIQFQNTLKSLLEHKLLDINSDIKIIENDIRVLKNEYSNLTEKLYIQKNEISRQENLLNQYNDSLTNIINIKETQKNELTRSKLNYDKKYLQLQNYEKQNKELQANIKIQNHRLHQLQIYEEKEISNVMMSQNAVGKNKTDKRKKLEEKQHLDHLLMKLENEIFKFELAIENYKSQLKIKCNDLNSLQNIVAKKITDIKITSQENKNVMKFWKHVILIISIRDQKFADLKKSQEKIEIDFKSKQIKLKTYSRDTTAEVLRNKTILCDRNKKKSMLNQVIQEYDEIMEKGKVSEEKLDKTEEMIESSARILKCDLEEQLNYNRNLTSLEIKLKNLNNRKHELEETILRQLQQDVVSSKASSQLNLEIEKLRKQILSLQNSLENETTKNVCDDRENLRNKEELLRTDLTILESLKNDIKIMENKLLQYEENLYKIKIHIKQQNSTIDNEKKQLQMFQEKAIICNMEKSKTMPQLNPDLSQKIEVYKENIMNIVRDTDAGKRQWIRNQQEVIILTKKRSKCFDDFNYIQKYVNILEQKISIINHDIIKINQKNASYDKFTCILLKKIEKLNAQYYDNKTHTNVLASENITAQNNILEKLKQCETSVMKIISEIESLQNRKELLEKEWLKLQQENLAWEKKIKLANEMRQNILTEQSEKGDVGRMKIEIHRMEIRYVQLKKVQDSLIYDLKNSAFKRNNIFDKATVKEKKKNEIAQNQQHTLLVKLENMKNKNIKLEKEVKSFENEYSILSNQKENILMNLKNYEEQAMLLNIEIEELNEKIEKLIFSKQKNLEVIIRKQRLADLLYRFKCGKIKPAFRNEIIAEKHSLKHRNLKSDLLHILENLRSSEYSSSMMQNEIIRLIHSAESLSI